jgi:hypothetical protein
MAVETTVVREAPFLEDIRKRLLESSEKLVETPITLPQQQLAPFSDATQQAFTQAQQGIGAYKPLLNSATGILQGLGDRTPGRLEEARLASLAGAGDITGRIQDFQDPYRTQVIDAFTAEATRQNEIAKNRMRDQAANVGALGGSGRYIQEAEMERGLADVLQRNTAGLLSQGYTQGLGAAEREAARLQQVPGQLMGIEQLQYQLPQSVAANQANLAGITQQLPATDIALLSQIGSQQQKQGQTALDLERQNRLAQLYEPYQRLGYLGDILKGQPSSTSTLTQSTDPRTNPLSQALGAGISLAGIFGNQGFGSGYLFGNPSLAGKLPIA